MNEAHGQVTLTVNMSFLYVNCFAAKYENHENVDKHLIFSIMFKSFKMK